MESVRTEIFLSPARTLRGQAARPTRLTQILAISPALVSVSLSGCHSHEEHGEESHHKVVVTSPKEMDVILTQQYVCQIHSQRHIKVCALESGYLEEIPVKEGQAVQKGDVMFKVIPVLYRAKLDAELA